MKKLYSLVLMVFVSVLCSLSAFAQSGGPASPFYNASFMGSTKQIQVSTNGYNTASGGNTYTAGWNYGAYGIPFLAGNMIYNTSLGTNYIYPTIDAAGYYWYTNAAPYTTTNPLAGGLATNIASGVLPWVDVPINSDVNGNIPNTYAITAVVSGATVNDTNPITFVFNTDAGDVNTYVNTSHYSQTNYGGNAGFPPPFINPSYGTKTTIFARPEGLTQSAYNTFQFTVMPGGPTNTVFFTNLPSIFLQGASKIRLSRLTVVTNIPGGGQAANGGFVFINSLNLRGFRP